MEPRPRMRAWRVSVLGEPDEGDETVSGQLLQVDVKGVTAVVWSRVV